MLNKKALAATAAAAEPVYVEDVFSTYLYTGNGTIQQITNNIALSDNGSFVVYQNATNLAALNGSFAAQSGDIIVSFVLNTGGSAVTFTLNGSSKTAATTFVDGNNYWSGVFIETLSAGANTFSTGSVNNGYTNTVVIRGASSVSVGTNLATLGTNDTATTSSFATTGFGLLLIYDRDTSATPTISGSYTATDYTATYFKSRFLAVSGNGSTVASQSVSGLVASYEGVYCGLKIEGLGAAIPTVSGNGGMVWVKARSVAESNQLVDTVRGNTKYLVSNNTDSEDTITTRVTSFNGNGFSLGSHSIVNGNGNTYASWTFRKAEKFFDVVTFSTSGTLSTDRRISHSLGSAPGTIIVKRTNDLQSWLVYHRSTGRSAYLNLDTTSASTSLTNAWGSTDPTSSDFGINENQLCYTNSTYVAYLFAHDAGGFGDDGSQNVISCGSVVLDGSGNGNVTLGYEPQWILAKQSSAISAWQLTDTMRGMPVAGNTSFLEANTSAAEDVTSATTYPTATGFKVSGSSFSANATVIYIAIRRGPMKTPESGTSVYYGLSRTTTTSDATITGVGFSTDLVITRHIPNDGSGTGFYDRLRGNSNALTATGTTTEQTGKNGLISVNMDGITVKGSSSTNDTYINYVASGTTTEMLWFMKRAPGFFDIVCYTGTGSARTLNHNLGVTPELMIVKRRDTTGSWAVYNAASGNTKFLALETTAAAATSSKRWNDTSPTSTVFTVGDDASVNASSGTYVAYLFASVTGVSKVGSYTGNGSSQTINCGFTAGARFIMIKRTDSTGDWKVIDTARGIVSGNDPTLALNSTAAEVTGTDCIDPDNSGFIVVQETTNNLNVNNATYIFLAVA